MNRMPLVMALCVAANFCEAAPAVASAKTVGITVDEGTSMSVAVSPDGKMLAMDLQGSIWVMPATGGSAKRITDLFNDARQPVWSPDGKTIAFFAYRDGGYDLWAINPDGSNQHQLTQGAFDDRPGHVFRDLSLVGAVEEVCVANADPASPCLGHRAEQQRCLAVATRGRDENVLTGGHPGDEPGEFFRSVSESIALHRRP